MLRRITQLILGLVLLPWLASCLGGGEVTALPNSDDVLFADDFSVGHTGRWLVEADDKGLTAVMNEQMVVEISAANTLQYSRLQEPAFSDFSLSVETAQLAGALESSFGILFRIEGPAEFYRFDVTGDGRYMIERRNADNTWTRFVDDWLSSPALNQGLNNPNVLRVVANGPQLTFYANDELLQQVHDSAYTSGLIALDGGTFGQPGLSVAFDNVVVRLP